MSERESETLKMIQRTSDQVIKDFIAAQEQTLRAFERINSQLADCVDRQEAELCRLNTEIEQRRKDREAVAQ